MSQDFSPAVHTSITLDCIRRAVQDGYFPSFRGIVPGDEPVFNLNLFFLERAYPPLTLRIVHRPIFGGAESDLPRIVEPGTDDFID